ncbi:hypothetical protein [Nesterenkonia rhizosphaerae]
MTYSTVTGIFKDPASTDTQQAYMLTDVDDDSVSAFITTEDPFLDSEQTSLFEQKLFTYNSLGALKAVAAADASATYFTHGLNVLQGLWLAFGILLGISAWVLARSLVQPFRGLIAAGFTRRRTLKVLSVLLAAVIVPSALAGIALALGATWWGRESISGLFAQDWLSIVPPVSPILLIPLAAGSLGIVIGLRAHSVSESFRGRHWPLRFNADTPRVAVITVISASVVSALLVWGASQQWVSPEPALLAIFITLVIAPWAYSAVLRKVLLPPVLRRATREGGFIVLATAIVTSALVVSTVTFTAYTTHAYRSAEAAASPTMAPGSLAVDAIPSAQAAELRAYYLEAGGTEPTAYLLPLEDVSDFRVTSPAVVQCMDEHEEPDPWFVTELCGLEPKLSYAVIAPDGGNTVRAAPDLVDDEETFIVTFPSGQSDTDRRIQVDEVVPDEGLVPPLAGAVIGEESALIGELNLQVSDLRQLVFTDFYTFSGPEQAAFRSYVSRIAPGAEMVQIDPDSWANEARLLITVNLGAGILLVICLLISTRFALSSMRETRGVLALFSSTGRIQIRIAASFIAVWTVALIATACGGVLTAWLMSLKDGLGSGWLWAIAPSLGGLALVAAGVHMSRILLSPGSPHERTR